MSEEINVQVKRIQAWVSRQLKVQSIESRCSMNDVRVVYLDDAIVINPEQPTPEEFIKVREMVLKNVMNFDQSNQSVEAKEDSLIVTIDSVQDDLDDWNDDQNSEESSLTVQNESSNESTLSTELSNESINVLEKVQEQFPNETKEVVDVIVEYAESKAYSNAEELSQSLKDINDAELSVLLQIAKDRTDDRRRNFEIFQEHLNKVSEGDEKKLKLKIVQKKERLIQFKQRFNVQV